MPDLAIIGWSAAISTTCTAALAFLFREWISTRIRESIKHEYETKAERLRADLQIAGIERQIRFSHLHEKMAETIAETYSRLDELTRAVGSYVNPAEFGDKSKEDRRKYVGQKLGAFFEYFRKRRLYLPRQLADKISSFEEHLFMLTREFLVLVEGKPLEGTDDWARLNDKFNEESRPLFMALEEEFRKLLGPNTDSNER